MVKVRRHDGTGFNHSKALNLRLFFQGALNPDGIKAKSWIDGFSRPAASLPPYRG
ncbi:Uncharacterised protein [Salmonella bongori]|nr:Uncharacterised protein [Salmonella bongori]